MKIVNESEELECTRMKELGDATKRMKELERATKRMKNLKHVVKRMKSLEHATKRKAKEGMTIQYNKSVPCK